MFLIAIKFVEVVARAGFTVAALFVMPLQLAGQFGLSVTFIALFAFILGWERYIDLQRRLVGEEDHVFDRGVRNALRFYAFNWIALLPLFWISIGFAAHLAPSMIAAASVIVIGEQLSNHLYALTVVQPRYLPAMVTVAVKNSLLALVVLGEILFGGHSLTIEFVLTTWAICSGLGMMAMGLMWMAVRQSGETDHPVARLRIFAQHRASIAHFGIGLLAVLSLQGDRLIAGTLLKAEEAGIYFRHVLVISFAYQAFNIVSYNRLVPRVFAAAKTEAVSYLARIIRAEFIAILILVLIGFGAALALQILFGEILNRLHLDVRIGAILVLGALLRVAADLLAMILNARMREIAILRNQLVAVLTGAAVLVPAAMLFGPLGAAAATLILSTTYLLFNLAAVRQETQAMRPPHSGCADRSATPTERAHLHPRGSG
jgi:O-antigen/teichoic acid export membrane protein